MKNFVRLVRFTWPRRYRFALSVGCAAMVALLYFTELGAVLPLLKILFNNENPQRWISSKIDSIEENIVVLNAQADEVRMIKAAAELGARQSSELAEHYRELDQEASAVGDRLREHQRLVDLPDLKRQSIPNVKHDPAEIEALKPRQRIVEERLKELSRGSKWLKEGKLASLRYREEEIKDDLKSEEVWLGRKTEWYADESGRESPTGQKTLLVDGEEFPFLEVRTLKFFHPAPTTTEQ